MCCKGNAFPAGNKKIATAPRVEGYSDFLSLNSVFKEA